MKMKLKKTRKKLTALSIVLCLCLQLPIPVSADELDSVSEFETAEPVQEMAGSEGEETGSELQTEENIFDSEVSRTVQARPQFQVTPDDDGRKYDVALSEYVLPDDGECLSFGIWNADQGQVRWYDAMYDADRECYEAVVDIMDFHAAGTYYVHCYYTDQNGEKNYVDGTEFTVNSLPTESTPENHPMITKAAFTDTSEKQYVLEISNCSLQAGSYLKAAVWSDANGQDDLKWNTMTPSQKDTYSLNISVADYRSAGKYLVHIYCCHADGTMEYVLGTNFVVQEMGNGRVSVEEEVYEQGTATIRIAGILAPSGIQQVRVPIWSKADQSDIYWYNAVKEGSDWCVNMVLSRHKNNRAVYTAHAYATDGHGFQKFVGGVSVDFSAEKQVPLTSVDYQKNVCTIRLQNFHASSDVKRVMCSIRNEQGEQEDELQYEVDYDSQTGIWKKEIPLAELKGAGRYNADIYLELNDGSMVLWGKNVFTILPPDVKRIQVAADQATGDFKISMLHLQSVNGIAKVEAAVWSRSDMSDLQWYAAQKQYDGSYTVSSNISRHKYNLGLYNIHVYITDKDGKKTIVECSNMTFAYSFEKLKINNDSKETAYTAQLSKLSYPAGLKKVEFAVWSEAGGQDDVRWYTASPNGDSYSAVIDIRNHKTAGKYLVHVYGTNKNGDKVYITGSSELVVEGKAAGTAKITGRNDGAGTFEVTISGITAKAGVSSVKIAAWTDASGKDMAWYTCTPQGNGTYKATVRVANHQQHMGNYNVHGYAVLGNGIQTFTCGLSYDFQAVNYMYILNEQKKGSRTIVLVNPSDTANLRFGAWSDTNGQDDLVWYPASRAGDGTWRAAVSARNHKNSGNFQVHAYSNSKALTIGSFYFPASEFSKNGWYYENGYKLYYVNNVLQKDVSGIIGPQSSYLARVNRTTCTVTIYAKDGANGYIIPVKVFACSVGLPGTPTPTGTFQTSAKYRWHELMGPSYGQYCTRIVGGVLFHSVAGSNMTSYNLSASEYNKLGSPASHGCVRLCVRDAKWIYDNCRLGMTVVIYDSANPGPFGKPGTIKIPSYQNWDPTDPNI